MRNIFFIANRESEKLKSLVFEVECSGERFSVSADNILVSAANTLAEVKKENLKPNEFFHSVKTQTLEAYYKKLSESSLLADLDAFFTQFKEDSVFFHTKVRGLLREEHYNLLVEVDKQLI